MRMYRVTLSQSTTLMARNPEEAIVSSDRVPIDRFVDHDVRVEQVEAPGCDPLPIACAPTRFELLCAGLARRIEALPRLLTIGTQPEDDVT